mgnify:CR=1 FL=1
MKVGIIGAGGIAVTMAKTLKRWRTQQHMQWHPVNLAKAQAFAGKESDRKGVRFL